MIASELIKILKARPDAEVLVITGKYQRTHVADSVELMAHTVFIVASKTPAETDQADEFKGISK